MKIPNLKFNEQYAFFVFVSVLSFFGFLLSGCATFASFISAIFIYAFLRFANFLWKLIIKIIGRDLPYGRKQS